MVSATSLLGSTASIRFRALFFFLRDDRQELVVISSEDYVSSSHELLLLVFGDSLRGSRILEVFWTIRNGRPILFSQCPWVRLPCDFGRGFDMGVPLLPRALLASPTPKTSVSLTVRSPLRLCHRNLKKKKKNTESILEHNLACGLDSVREINVCGEGWGLK